MIRRVPVLLLAMFIFAGVTVSGDGVRRVISESDFAFIDAGSGVRVLWLDQKLESVRDKHGVPDSVEEIEPEPQFVRYRYDGFSIDVARQSNTVYSITVTEPGLATVRGVSVGDSISDVYDAYSAGFFRRTEHGISTQFFLSDRVIDTTFSLFFEVGADDQIERILIGYAW